MNAPRKTRVLFVDDEARILRSLRALFRNEEVYVTTDPDQAIEIARNQDLDVVVCDQRMPQRTGIEVLNQIRQISPRTMRILLTGYSDLKAVVGSVNEGEVFRYVTKPWNNEMLRSLVATAATLSNERPVEETVTEHDQESARNQVGILVIEDDPLVQSRLREILNQQYLVYFAASAEKALQIMEQHETGVVISETYSGQGDVTGLIKALKRYHPQIATVVITERANAQLAINLINEGQIYRLLLKPVREQMTKLSVESALGHYCNLKRSPTSARRYRVDSEDLDQVPLAGTLMQRLRGLPQRLMRLT